MSRARTPRQKGADNKPEILRSVRLGDAGDVYGPGEEDEFLEALEEYVDEHNDREENENRQLDVNEELERLHILGHLVNFKGIEIDEDDIEDQDHDLTANRVARRRAMVEAPGDESTPAPRKRRSTKRTRTTKGVESNKKLKREDDGGDADETDETDEGKK